MCGDDEGERHDGADHRPDVSFDELDREERTCQGEADPKERPGQVDARQEVAQRDHEQDRLGNLLARQVPACREEDQQRDGAPHACPMEEVGVALAARLLPERSPVTPTEPGAEDESGGSGDGPEEGDRLGPDVDKREADPADHRP